MLCETVDHHRRVAELAVTLLEQLHRKADRWAVAFAADWERDLQATTPTRTGQMRDRTTVRAEGRTVTATVDTEYAHIVAYGAAPHVIEARPGGMLAFPNQAGEIIYRRSVNHPGTQPNPWWANSIDQIPQRAQQVWDRLG